MLTDLGKTNAAMTQKQDTVNVADVGSRMAIEGCQSLLLSADASHKHPNGFIPQHSTASECVEDLILQNDKSLLSSTT